MLIKREWFEKLIFSGEASRRFTQDSPILPDVWIAFAMLLPTEPAGRIDLLLTPHRDSSAPELFRAVLDRLQAERKTNAWPPRHTGSKTTQTLLAYHQSAVAVKLSFDELIRVVLPLSGWWRDAVLRKQEDLATYLRANFNRVTKAMQHMASDPQAAPETRDATPPVSESTPELPISADLLWMIRCTGTLLVASRDNTLDVPDPQDHFFEISLRYAQLLTAFIELVGGTVTVRPAHQQLLYTVTRNRKVTPTIARSVQSIKSDAAMRVFEIDTRNIVWAVIDSGIDATHPAFRLRKSDLRSRNVRMPRQPAVAANPPAVAAPGPAVPPEPERPRHDEPFTQLTARADGPWRNNTCVLKSFDFSRIRDLLCPDMSEADRWSNAPAIANAVVGSAAAPAATGVAGGEGAAAGPAPAAPSNTGELDLSPPTVTMRAAELTRRIASGRAIDWDELRPLLEIPHDARYISPSPRFDHGTHVAGILASDWRRDECRPADFPEDQPTDLIGVCPGLSLYDMRVLNSKGEGDEFTVMAALQFVRYLNAEREQQAIQGVNLSLSLKHDVANFACGRTPVCEECERVVGSGVVVVAAAGNDGHQKFNTPAGESEFYQSISISDPGNADAVITVGATHRSSPHTYGVSYFSSRGPTGDGRLKPDLVAPGEKITAPVLNRRAGTKDGTSMAAPHVSGAAALLMARHRELLGNPVRIKQILCETATDLRRERYFQGAGMVDVLRALQSV